MLKIVLKTVRTALGLLVLTVAGCGGGGGSGDNSATPAPGPVDNPSASLFEVVSESAWDDTAVRQVLHTFAFGGHATDTQIKAWADMPPRQAINEILDLSPRHDKLSPPDDFDAIAEHAGSLEAMRAYWASDAADNPVGEALRPLFEIGGPAIAVATELSWSYAATKFGVNPIRQRLGLFETNYHMVIHQLIGEVNDAQTLTYYDAIVEGLARGDDYEDVLTEAALSAAIAAHYGHFENIYVNGEFFGNEDFGREYHQLFFGILGRDDPQTHEEVTIKNTAQALSGIQLPFGPSGNLAAIPTYSTQLHNPNDLNILGEMISGASAKEKFENLADVAINHPESLDNLPVLIISELADDNLGDAAIAELQRAWRSMQDKNLLRFLRDYAISPLFHSPDRIKYLSSIERTVLLQNLANLNNLESYLNIHDLFRYNEIEGVQVFKPVNNVFGNQRGVDAALSSEVFRSIYNRSTEEYSRLVLPAFDLPDGSRWVRDWTQAIAPNPVSDDYSVEYVAEWLWQRFIADGLDNFGALERAQVYALLVSGRDFAWLLSDGAEPDRIISAEELETDESLVAFLNDLGANPVLLDADDPQQRLFANAGVGQAINFIVATPYALALQGRHSP